MFVEGLLLLSTRVSRTAGVRGVRADWRWRGLPGAAGLGKLGQMTQRAQLGSGVKGLIALKIHY